MFCKELNITSPKLGCGEGGCGACTVIVSQCIDGDSGEIEHRTVNGCLTLLCSVDGCHIITVEALGSTNRSNLHPTQSRLAELYGTQCGFCTPGIIMSLYGTITSKNEPPPTLQDIEESLDGNLCRCTGYRPILDTAKTFASDIDKLPKEKSSKFTSTTLDKCLLFSKENMPPSEQVEFPPKLRKHIFRSIHIKGIISFDLRINCICRCLGSSIDWYRPVSIQELLHLRRTYPGDASILVFGGTRIQIERKFNHRKYSRLISATHIKELQKLERTGDSLILGAGVTFTRLQAKLIEWNNEAIIDGGLCRALLDQLKHFASSQIRNVASLGGNIVSASPT